MILNHWERGQNQVYSRPSSPHTPRKKSGVSRSENIAERFISSVTNRKGLIRLSYVRENFPWNYLKKRWGRQILSQCYSEWVKTDEYLWFAKIDKRTGEKVKEFCSKCSKRGNDVYRWRLKKRLEWIDDMEFEEFFNPHKRDVRGERTKMLFVSLTYDTKRCSIVEAWRNIGEEWNRWITAVRRKYGRVYVFDSYESFENGYPHLHVVLVFQDADFEVSFRDKNKRFRILRKEKDWFDSLWHSHVDVQACFSTGALGYVKKYLLKIYGKGKGSKDVGGVTPESAIRTLSLLWLFRKQSFSISGGMRELIEEIYDLIQEKHNSNAIFSPSASEAESVYEIRLMDIVTLEELFLSREPPPKVKEKWSFELSLLARVKHKLSRTGGSCQLGLSFYCPADFQGGSGG